jgi:predicted transglutaminase-like cysteine proteinase
MQAIVHAIVLLSSLTAGVPNLDARAWMHRQLSPMTIEASLVIGARAVAPYGAVVFCRDHAESCESRPAHDIPVVGGRVVASPAILRRVSEINAIVNRTMRPRIDEHWHVGGPTGDCKDYALTKRDMLNRAGFPTSATLIATARDRAGRMHAVLIVRTDRGDFVLDNLTPAVLRWDAVPYAWEKVQSPSNPAVWLTIAEPAVS